MRRSLKNCYRVLIIAISAVVAAATMITTAPSAKAASDFTITVTASDFGIDPALFQQLSNQVNAQDASLHMSLNDRFKRTIQAAGEDDSLIASWVNFDATWNVTPTSVSMTIPGSEVQTSSAWWKAVVTTLLSVGFAWVVQTACWGFITAFTGPAAPIVGLVCIPLAGALGGLFGSVFGAAITGTLGTPQFYASLVVSVIAGAVGGFLWAKWIQGWAEGGLATLFNNLGNWVRNQSGTVGFFFGSGASGAVSATGGIFTQAAPLLANAARNAATATAGPDPCGVYADDGNPCAAAYSMVRALKSTYSGPLYQVQRASDGATADIGLLSRGGFVDASQQDSFCTGTTCTVTELFDQSPEWNDLFVEGAGGAGVADHAANATALPITINGHKAYGLDIEQQTGYRNDSTKGIAVNGQPEGMYMVASGTHVNRGCCFDFGNAETNNNDNGNGHMDAVNLSTTCFFAPCSGSGPWVEADMENGLFQGGNGSNLNNKGNGTNFVTAMLKNNGQTTYALKGGDAQSGGLSTWYSGPLPNLGGYTPMHQEGAILLGTGGDNSNASIGSFFEGVMTSGYPSDPADNAVQANIVAAGYGGNSNPAGGPGSGSTQGQLPSAAGQAVLHTAGATGAGANGFASVYTVDSRDGHLQETYLTNIGANWNTQDLSNNYGTPPVMPGTEPVSIVHCGYTSVYTVDRDNGHLQETYLPAIGQPWTTQDLTANYGTPPTRVTPTAVVHTAGATGAPATCGFTSVYTIDTSSGDLQETYLPIIGGPWTTQNLSANYGTPPVQAGTSPVAIVHCGFTSVYTVDANHQLQETYLPAIGRPWNTQSLSANYGTPLTVTTPTAVVHAAGATGAPATCGFTSVYTVDQGSNNLQETYLPIIGGPWNTQNLTANYGTPPVAPGTQPEALYHTNFTSVYTVDQVSEHLQETYLPAIGQPWTSQDLSTKYGTPPTDQSPAVLLHPDTSGNQWSSVYTTDLFSDNLQETYLPAIGQPWTSQDLSTKYGTPIVGEPQSSEASWSVDHAGFTSVYTVDKANQDLQETYLTGIGAAWNTQDLSARYGTPHVILGIAPISLFHTGFTSVYTVDASNGHLQETYLPAIGQPWTSQDLSAQFGTPSTVVSPTAVFHDGFTSVYTVNASNGHLWETYLTGIGAPWHSQDLTANYGTPPVRAGTAPVALLHDGFTSVYTVDASNGHLQETYLIAIGDPWHSQDLSANYGTPVTAVTPTALFHDGYASVYTVDASNNDLQETYLPDIGDPWHSQDLSANYGVPAVARGQAPVALFHTGYASVYFLNGSSGDLDEAYLPAIGGPWHSQDLSAGFGTPVPDQPASPLVHYAANGGLTWTSVYTVDKSNNDLQETYLPAIGDAWTTQDLSARYGTPPV